METSAQSVAVKCSTVIGTMLTTANFVTSGQKANVMIRNANSVRHDPINLVKHFHNMTKENKELEIEFAPGCFDNFDGTQEELDELVNEIKRMFASGEAQAMARPIDFDDLSEEDLELLEKFSEQEENVNGRTLQ